MSSLTRVIKAMQILGILPFVVKGKKHLKPDSVKKMKVSQLMWIWCIFVRVVYVATQSVFACYSSKHMESFADSISMYGINILFYTFIFNTLWAPVKWKTNLLLLNHLLKLKRMVGCSEYQRSNPNATTLSIFAVTVLIILICRSLYIFLPNSDLFIGISVMLVTTYYLALVVVQVMFFKICCLTIEDCVPDLTCTSYITSMKSYTFATKAVRTRGA